jgi:Flp pilus assembly protein TadG
VKGKQHYLMIRNEQGGSLVEFAIVVPILLLLLAGLVEFGIMYYDKQVLTNASREGARAGIVNVDLDSDGNKDIVSEADIQALVKSYCENESGQSRLITFGGSSLPVTTATGVDSKNYPEDLTVTVTFSYTFLLSSLFNLFGGDFGPTLDISAVTVMRME